MIEVYGLFSLDIQVNATVCVFLCEKGEKREEKTCKSGM